MGIAVPKKTSAADSPSVEPGANTSKASKEVAPVVAGEGKTSPVSPQGNNQEAPLNPLEQLQGALENVGGEKTVEKDEGRDPEEYYSNIILKPGDVGRTLASVIKSAQEGYDAVSRLSETEERILDEMLSNGYATHEIFLKKNFPVRFRTANALAVRRGYDILAEEKGRPEKHENMYTCMVVATYIDLYGNLDSKLNLSHQGKEQEEFISSDAIRERYEWISDKLDTTIVNVLLDRLKSFLDVAKRAATYENILNF